MVKSSDNAWEVGATSGMCGTSIDDGFLEELSKKEMKYLYKQIKHINTKCFDIMYEKGWL